LMLIIGATKTGSSNLFSCQSSSTCGESYKSFKTLNGPNLLAPSYTLAAPSFPSIHQILIPLHLYPTTIFQPRSN